MEGINKIKISLILNYIIIIFTIMASIVMFTGIKFMYGMEPKLESSTLGMFRFFTVDSNILMGIISLIFVYQERKLLKNKISHISIKYYVLKLIGTVSVTLTFVVVVGYLRTIVSGGLMPLLQNSNLFFHLIIPVLSIITFCFFEKTRAIKFRYTLLGLLPVTIYGIYYLTNVLLHIEDGKVLPKYDWYWFVQGGLNQIYLVIPIILSLTFIISVILWKINKIHK